MVQFFCRGHSYFVAVQPQWQGNLVEKCLVLSSDGTTMVGGGGGASHWSVHPHWFPYQTRFGGAGVPMGLHFTDTSQIDGPTHANHSRSQETRHAGTAPSVAGDRTSTSGRVVTTINVVFLEVQDPLTVFVLLTITIYYIQVRIQLFCSMYSPQSNYTTGGPSFSVYF